MAESTMPTVRDMIHTHTLAENIISRHASPPGDSSILDYDELRLLRRFCNDPTSKNAILEHEGMLDDPGMEPGTKAQSTKGSLVGFCIARYGVAGKEALRPEEVQRLRTWFDEGGAAEMDQ